MWGLRIERMPTIMPEVQVFEKSEGEKKLPLLSFVFDISFREGCVYNFEFLKNTIFLFKIMF